MLVESKLVSIRLSRLKANSLKKGRGFSLIEILISVLVLAVGILGMGGLQISSLQNSTRSIMRTQAAYLSYEILDKMRANADQAAAYVTASASSTFSTTNCILNACDAAGLATYDVTEWKCALGETSACGSLPSSSLVSADNALPNGAGSITVNDNLYTITIQWNEERTGATGNLQSLTLETTL